MRRTTHPPVSASSTPPKPSAADLPPSPPLSPKTSSAPPVQTSPSRRPRLSAVDRLLHTIRLLKAGRLEREEEYLLFRLSEDEYSSLHIRLEQDDSLWAWYEDKVRCDWDPPAEKGKRGRYTLRMPPTALHEWLIADVEDAVTDGIEQLADRVEKEDEIVAKALRQVRKGRSTTMELQRPVLENSSQEESAEEGKSTSKSKPQRSPDATFINPEVSRWPCVVVEVAYSQRTKNLSHLAEDYVVDSQHEIRCVLGLDLAYDSKKKKPDRAEKKQQPTVSLWRPGFDEDGAGICRTDIDAAQFQDATSGGLTFHVSDFLPPSTLECLPATTTVEEEQARSFTITFSDLAAMLSKAEEKIPAMPHTTPSNTSGKGQKFRKRKRTPEKEASDENEEAAVRRAEKELKEDGEWRARVRRRADVGQEAGLERRRSLRRRVSGRAVAEGS
ncbi:uncharacterized protein LTR77_001919 [Saxophila tyrrhenica]|uniref:Uncharacterized protein n=1 Tax=Saxophila tyrrhenica TaxID=1690608 RepID=A0AAV9PHZ4_9PEZI|nr:hypothetical protein LTR77_001919 [Saxophila tyrrhenica]